MPTLEWRTDGSSMELIFFIEVLAGGLLAGVMYALVALGFVLEGLSQLLWGSQPHGLELGIPDVPMEWLSRKWNVNISQFDLFAAFVAGALVAVLALLFQKTRIGRALRAVADDHQAALAVGIPLQHICAIVWAVAGF